MRCINPCTNKSMTDTYLQSTDNREEFDNLVEKEDYDSLLYLAREYDQGDALSQSQTYKDAEKFSGDDILAEDDNYAVVYNNSVGGTYDLMRKVTKQDIIDNIERYGLESDASDDVKKVAFENVAKQFSDIKSKIPAFTMPNEDVLYFQYNQESNKIEVGTTTTQVLKLTKPLITMLNILLMTTWKVCMNSFLNCLNTNRQMSRKKIWMKSWSQNLLMRIFLRMKIQKRS